MWLRNEIREGLVQLGPDIILLKHKLITFLKTEMISEGNNSLVAFV